MNFMQMKETKRKVTIVNGCSVLERTSEDELGFSIEIVKLDENNFIGYEFNGSFQVQIDILRAENKSNFCQMMDALVLIAKSQGYSKLFFAGNEEDNLQNLKSYGFAQISGDGWNTFLCMNLERGNDDDV